MKTIQFYASAFLIIASVTLVFIVTIYGWTQLITRESRVAVASTAQCVVPARNVSAGQFGGGSGIFSFPEAVGIGVTNPGAQLHIADIFSAGGRNLQIGDDTFFTDVDAVNTLGLYGAQDNDQAHLRLGSGGQTISGVSGRIGIGTTSPLERLHVDGGNILVRLFPANDSTPSLTGLRLTNRGAGGNEFHWNLMTAAVGGGWGVNPNAFEIWEYPATASRFQIRPGGNTILAPSGGNVGIGTTTPQARLDVIGQIRSTEGNIINHAGPTLFLQDTNHRSAMVHVNDNLFYVLRGAGTNSLSWASVYGRWPLVINLENNDASFGRNVTAVAYFHHSDKTLKTNIKPLENSLERILGIEGVSFNWREGGEESIGFVAQDVEKKFPELVTTDQQTGLKSVNYSGFIAVLIQAMQEQQKQIDRQETLIEQLKAEIERLR